LHGSPAVAIADLEVENDSFIDARELSELVDRLHGKLSRVVAAAKKLAGHLLAWQSAPSWVATQCQMSKTSAADRLCVGEQLQHLPQIAQALSSGQIGAYETSVGRETPGRLTAVHHGTHRVLGDQSSAKPHLLGQRLKAQCFAPRQYGQKLKIGARSRP